MSGFELTIELDAAGKTPLFRQLSQALVDAIQSGRLLRGAAVPGSRRLAQTLHIHRNTVLSAFNALVAEGWLQARPGGGTFVAKESPSVRSLGDVVTYRQRAGFPVSPPLEYMVTPRSTRRRWF